MLFFLKQKFNFQREKKIKFQVYLLYKDNIRIFSECVCSSYPGSYFFDIQKLFFRPQQKFSVFDSGLQVVQMMIFVSNLLYRNSPCHKPKIQYFCYWVVDGSNKSQYAQ